MIGCALGGSVLKILPDEDGFKGADYLTRLSALIYLNFENPRAAAQEILSDLKTDKFTRAYVDSVIETYFDAEFASVTDTLKLLMNYGKDAVIGALKLGNLLCKYANREEEIFREALSSGKPYTLAGLDVRGTDIISLGIKGEAVGDTLRDLLLAVIDGKVENKREALIDYLSK